MHAAATTLISVVAGTQANIDYQIQDCAKRARQLFEEITGLPWMRRS
jgi:hypothetical protein